jgi:release factor glutamine methyltransferase
MRVRDALAGAAMRLEAISDTARLDAELLMAHARGVDRGTLLLRHLDEPAPHAFEALVDRRLAHEPVAYITGLREFWSLPFKVGPGVLIPRPDSETLIEAAVAHFGDRAPRRILDLGTGPGTLLLAALSAFPAATGLGIEASDIALTFARANAVALGVAPRATFRAGDWANGVEGPFDLVLSNPPYVEVDAVLAPEVREWEPAAALFAGVDGLDAYRVLAPQIARLIAPGGVACVEIGHDQAAAVAALFAAEGLTPRVRRDLGGRDRCLVVTV